MSSRHDGGKDGIIVTVAVVGAAVAVVLALTVIVHVLVALFRKQPAKTFAQTRYLVYV